MSDRTDLPESGAKPDGYIRKGWLFREIASPLSDIHSTLNHGEGCLRCNCELSAILRKLDAAMMTKQKKRRKIHAR